MEKPVTSTKVVKSSEIRCRLESRISKVWLILGFTIVDGRGEESRVKCVEKLHDPRSMLKVRDGPYLVSRCHNGVTGFEKRVLQKDGSSQLINNITLYNVHRRYHH